MKWPLITVFIFTAVLFISYYIATLSTNESFFSYKRYPSGFVNTGSDPPGFYERPQYRKPYRDGYLVAKSYPYSHLGPLDFGPQV